MKRKRVILVSGMSGAGKTSATSVLEDMGYHCIDQFPVQLLSLLADLIETSTDPRYSYTALSTSAKDFPEFLNAFHGENMDVRVLFLDASNEALLHRYKSTRRTHPLLISNVCNTLEEAISVERQMFRNYKDTAFLSVDTTFLKASELKQKIEKYFSLSSAPVFSISFISFGYKHGVPLDADLMIDVRFLPNPYWEVELRPYSGDDPQVYHYVMDKPETQEFVGHLLEFLDYAFKEYVKEGKNHFTVAIGCTGGQHRSVSITNFLYDHYKPQYNCYKEHRDKRAWMNNKPLNVVVIGGGHGQSVILRGIKFIQDIQISAIVTVADDGGSTGRLRRQFHIPAMGDIRAVLIALAESETLLKNLMEYRFEGDPNGQGDQDVMGHNLGNLILTALTQSCGSFMESISILSKILNVRGDIIPATTQVITLYARMADGTIVRGESNIPTVSNRIDTVFYQETVKASEKAVKAILEADVILYGIGSIFTSILPNLIIPEIAEAIRKSHAYGVYLCNAMSQPGETDGFSMEDHVEALLRHGAKIDEVLFARDDIPPFILERYREEGSQPVRIEHQDHNYKVSLESLLDFRKDLVRHDSDKISRSMRRILAQVKE